MKSNKEILEKLKFRKELLEKGEAVCHQGNVGLKLTPEQAKETEKDKMIIKRDVFRQRLIKGSAVVEKKYKQIEKHL